MTIIRAGDGAVEFDGKQKVTHSASVVSVLYGDDKREIREETLNELRNRGEAPKVSAVRISMSPKSEISLFYGRNGSARAFLILDAKDHPDLPMEKRLIPLGEARIENLFDDLQPDKVGKGRLSPRTVGALTVVLDRRDLGLAFGVRGTQRVGEQPGIALPIKSGGGITLF
jgi:hypothetical protein